MFKYFFFIYFIFKISKIKINLWSPALITYLFVIVSDWIHVVLKKKINFLFQFFLFNKKNTVLFFSSFLKNEYYLFCCHKNIFKYLNLFFNVSLIDIACYDNTGLFFLRNFKKNYFINKLYIYDIDIYINVISNKVAGLNKFENSSWYLREAREFFNLKLNKGMDIRNLLTNYSDRSYVFLKRNKLNNFYDLKSVLNKSVHLNKNNVVL